MSIFSRSRSTKENLAGQKAARTLVLDRPLTSEECQLAEHLLRHAGVPGAVAFIPQLVHARVTGQCSCGCPTVDLAVPLDARVFDPPTNRPIADATGRVNGKVVGAMIFQNDGLLTLLEIYRLENFSEDAFGLPSVESIEKLVWDQPNQPIQ